MDEWLIAQPLVRLPPRIALVGLDEDLGGYLSDWFSVHWPEARVVVRARDLRPVADLVVVDHEPEQSPQQPTLWLAEIDRSQSLIRLGPRLWRTAMPTTARRLKRVMQACLHSVRE